MLVSLVKALFEFILNIYFGENIGYFYCMDTNFTIKYFNNEEMYLGMEQRARKMLDIIIILCRKTQD